jgi:hypothetical protein
VISAVRVDRLTTSCRDQQEREHPDGRCVVPCEISQPSIFVDLSANHLSSVDSSAELVSNEYDMKALELVTAGMILSSPLQILQNHHIWREQRLRAHQHQH